MSLRFTHHAVEQFATRYGGTEQDLMELATHASKTKERTAKGDQIWCAEGVRMVVKFDKGRRDPVCVTILPPEELLVGDPYVE